MKNLFLTAMLVIAGMAVAQPGNKEGKDQPQNRNLEQVASLTAKRLTLALDLTDQQQNAVYDLTLQELKARKERPTRKAINDMSTDQKSELRFQRLDRRIAVKRKMNTILNADQYSKWHAMIAQKLSERKDTSIINRPNRAKRPR